MLMRKKEVLCPACKAVLRQHELAQFTSPKIHVRLIRPCPVCNVPLAWSKLPFFLDLVNYIAVVVVCYLYLSGVVSEVIYVFVLPFLMLGFLMSTWAWKLKVIKKSAQIMR